MDVTFSVGSNTTYSVPLGVVPAASPPATSTSSTGTATPAATSTNGTDTATISAAALQLLASTTDSSLLAATLGGAQSVSAAADLSSSTSPGGAGTAAVENTMDGELMGSLGSPTSALSQLAGTNLPEAVRLGADLGLLRGSLSTTA